MINVLPPVLEDCLLRTFFDFPLGTLKLTGFSILYQVEDSLGPVVQCVVSLTSSLRVISLTVLADSIYNILIFLLKKCE